MELCYLPVIKMKSDLQLVVSILMIVSTTSQKCLKNVNNGQIWMVLKNIYG